MQTQTREASRDGPLLNRPLPAAMILPRPDIPCYRETSSSTFTGNPLAMLTLAARPTRKAGPALRQASTASPRQGAVGFARHRVNRIPSTTIPGTVPPIGVRLK